LRGQGKAELNFSIDREIVTGHCKVSLNKPSLAGSKLQGLRSTDIVYTEETLITFLELFVVKDLDSDHGRLSNFDIKDLVPSGGQGPSEDGCCTGLLSVDGEDREWIGKSEKFPLDKTARTIQVYFDRALGIIQSA
jgi:hypothetical protein